MNQKLDDFLSSHQNLCDHKTKGKKRYELRKEGYITFDDVCGTQSGYLWKDVNVKLSGHRENLVFHWFRIIVELVQIPDLFEEIGRASCRERV